MRVIMMVLKILWTKFTTIKQIHVEAVVLKNLMKIFQLEGNHNQFKKIITFNPIKLNMSQLTTHPIHLHL